MRAEPLIPILVLSACPALAEGPSVAYSHSTLSVNGSPAGIAVADFDGDGIVDIAVVADTLHVFRGRGDGIFAPHLVHVPAGENPADLDAGDVNEDGCLDLAIANHDTSYLTVLLSDCRGGFRPAPGSPVTIHVQPHPHAVALRDIDGDGHLDLITDNRRAESLLVLPGDGMGRFAHQGVNISVGGDPYRGFAIADLNGDGRPDFVTPNEASVGVILSRSNGSHEIAPEGGIPVGRPSSVALGDVTGDGRLDIVAAFEPSGGTVLAGDGKGGFVEVPSYRFETAAGQSNKIATGDLNADGLADAVVISYQSPEFTILYGGRRGSAAGRLTAGRNPWALAIADLDGNGWGDIIVGNAGGRTLTIFLSVPAAQEQRR